MGGHRFIPKPLTHAVGVAVRLAVFLVPALAAAQNEWLTWGYDVCTWDGKVYAFGLKK